MTTYLLMRTANCELNASGEPTFSGYLEMRLISELTDPDLHEKIEAKNLRAYRYQPVYIDNLDSTLGYFVSRMTPDHQFKFDELQKLADATNTMYKELKNAGINDFHRIQLDFFDRLRMWQRMNSITLDIFLKRAYPKIDPSKLMRSIDPLENAVPMNIPAPAITIKDLHYYSITQVSYWTEGHHTHLTPLPVVCTTFKSGLPADPDFPKLQKRAFDLLKQKNVPAHFIHFPIYQDEAGKMISEKSTCDLHDYITANLRKLDLATVRRLAAQMLLAVNELHSRNIVHVDIKPENFLVFERNSKHFLKLIDFTGVAEVDSSGIGQIKHLEWTMEYAPPEFSHLFKTSQHPAHLNLNYKAFDSFSVGRCLYHLEARTLLPGPSHRDLVNLRAGLLKADLASRLSITQAMESPFFGATAEERSVYFSEIYREASLNNSLIIDGYVTNKISLSYGDPFLLLDARIKPVFATARILSDKISICNELLLIPDMMLTIEGQLVEIQRRKYQLIEFVFKVHLAQDLEKFHSSMTSLVKVLESNISGIKEKFSREQCQARLSQMSFFSSIGQEEPAAIEVSEAASADHEAPGTAYASSVTSLR